MRACSLAEHHDAYNKSTECTLDYILSVKVNPIDITENLFFAIFGQKDTDDFTVSLKRKMQPNWTIYFFKVRPIFTTPYRA
ncbi:hypothetical protein E2986_13793 [Frieseomelitta varia]|uniref:Uncharacterized protein n=1 Tax=Frieseomelitta varia TaxID=561572 RepID=A0A833VMI2_9HYME|nr:hypothetical protein E2986_13793 [Frieseomelitta varia]